MSRRIPDRNIWVIYAAVLLLGIAYGTSIAVLAIHLKTYGIPKVAMGGLASAFALGIMIFAVPAGWCVARLGAKRTLLGALVGYAICVTSFPFLHTVPALSTARFFDGAFSAGVWVAAETALLSRADKSNKAFVMSLYAVALAAGYVIGPLLAHPLVAVWGTPATFVTSGILACGATLLVATMLEMDRGVRAHGVEAETSDTASSAFTVFWRTKTSCFATFSYGYFQASVVVFLPLYLIEEKNIPESRTILITAFFAAGMLALSTWMGRIGDRRGHLLVMRTLAAIGGVMVASFVVLPSFPLMCVAVFIAGATLASISPVSLALQGVVTPRVDLGRANAFYNASYAVGMFVGPTITGVLFTRYGGGVMLFHLAALWALFVTFTVVFASDDPRTQTKAPPRRSPEERALL